MPEHLYFSLWMTSAARKSSQRRKWRRSASSIHMRTENPSGVTAWSPLMWSAAVVRTPYAWDFRPYYQKDYCSGNDRRLFSNEGESVYVLIDSWSTSEKVINSCNHKGFHDIAALKTNRLICPLGISIKFSDFAEQYIRKADIHSVTVKVRLYWVYPYECPVSEIENVKLLLSWKDEYTASSKTEVCLLCADLSLDLVTIQRYYHVRWNIETDIVISGNCWVSTNTKAFVYRYSTILAIQF